MKELPIPFSGPMVRALLSGAKTQTRRVVKSCKDRDFGCAMAPSEIAGEVNTGNLRNSVFGQVGDRLWVREAWKAHPTFDDLPPRDIPRTHVWYMADDGYKAESRFRQGMFMPRWASRITLEISGVRVERLQDISVTDCIAEGIPRGGPENPDGIEKREYHALWESINGPGSWQANPWVWVVSFKRVRTGQ